MERLFQAISAQGAALQPPSRLIIIMKKVLKDHFGQYAAPLYNATSYVHSIRSDFFAHSSCWVRPQIYQ
jgi:hypothetical protein